MLDPTHLERWTHYLYVQKGLLEQTVTFYRRTVMLCAKENEADITQFDRLTIEMWLLAKGGAASTFCGRVSALRSFYRWLVRVELRLDDPTLNIETPKRRRGLPNPVKDLEAAMLVLDEYDGRVGLPVGQTRAICTFIGETGMRIAEACSVDIDGPAPDAIDIVGKGSEEDIVLLTDKAREALDFLGGKIPIGIRAVQRRVERAGFHPHQLRHWRASSLIEAGVDIGDVSKILRHKKISTTMIYAKFATTRLRAALDKAAAA